MRYLESLNIWGVDTSSPDVLVGAAILVLSAQQTQLAIVTV